jgi:uncharacterized membrane protein
VNAKSWLRNNFVAGVLVLVPLLGTAALFWWLFAKVTGPGYQWLLKRFRSEAVVREVMVPKATMHFLEENRTLTQVKDEVLKARFSRFPVYAGNTENITGLFLRGDLRKYPSEEELRKFKVKDVKRPIAFVPETKNVTDLLKEFHQTRQSMAVVVDGGKTAGFVAIDQLVGESFPFRQFLEKNELLFRGVVLLLMLGLTVLIGFLARNFLGRRVLRLGETILEKIPIVNRVYIALRQISQAFWGQNKTVFSHVVLLEYPRRGLYTLGFVTSPGRGEIKARTEERLVNVFLPTTPNPTSGWFVMVPEEHAVPLEMKVEDALKMIISGGAVVPEYRKAVSALEARHKKEEEAEKEEEVSAPHAD